MAIFDQFLTDPFHFGKINGISFTSNYTIKDDHTFIVNADDCMSEATSSSYSIIDRMIIEQLQTSIPIMRTN